MKAIVLFMLGFCCGWFSSNALHQSMERIEPWRPSAYWALAALFEAVILSYVL
jgi:hypothetical protein